MISIVQGEVFIDGNLTRDPELIGYAILDFAEAQAENINVIVIDQIDLN